MIVHIEAVPVVGNDVISLKKKTLFKDYCEIIVLSYKLAVKSYLAIDLSL